jgi:hypothetical protein
MRMHQDEAPTLTPVSDVKPSREEILERDAENGDSDVTPTTGENREEQGPIDGDIEMANGLDSSGTYDEKEGTARQDEADHRRTDHDWHWSEPTARPDAVAAHLSGSMGSLYKLSSTRKEPCTLRTFSHFSPLVFCFLGC